MTERGNTAPFKARNPRSKPVAPGAAPGTIPTSHTVAAVAQQPAPVIVSDPASAGQGVAQQVAAAASAAVEQITENSISTAAPVASALHEGPESMATTIDTATEINADKAQAAFGDAQARIKAAWEKSSKFGEEFIELAKGNVEAVVASARVAARHSEELGQEAADYGKKSFENAMAVFRGFASAKSPTEFFQLQSDFAKSSFDSAVAEASKVSEKLLKIAGEVAQPISNRYAVAAEKLKSNF